MGLHLIQPGCLHQPHHCLLLPIQHWPKYIITILTAYYMFIYKLHIYQVHIPCTYCKFGYFFISTSTRCMHMVIFLYILYISFFHLPLALIQKAIWIKVKGHKWNGNLLKWNLCSAGTQIHNLLINSLMFNP